MSDQISLKSLKPDKRNARRRTAQSKHLIQESLNRYGAARSIVIDEDNVVLAGNGTIEGAQAAGISNVKVVETDGTEIIAVRRTDLSKHDKIGLALADNRTSELSEWDAELLHTLSKEQDIKPWFSEDDITELLGKQDNIGDEIADDQTEYLKEQFNILIEFTNEFEQSAAIETFTKQGFLCRALNS